LWQIEAIARWRR